MSLRRVFHLPALLPIAALSAGLSACATTTSLPPTEVLRYHLGEPIDRGTISVQPPGAVNALLA